MHKKDFLILVESTYAQKRYVCKSKTRSNIKTHDIFILPIFCLYNIIGLNLAMSNANGLLSQKLCHCLNQGRTLNDILMRAAYWMAYFDLSKLYLA